MAHQAEIERFIVPSFYPHHQAGSSPPLPPFSISISPNRGKFTKNGSVLKFPVSCSSFLHYFSFSRETVPASCRNFSFWIFSSVNSKILLRLELLQIFEGKNSLHKSVSAEKLNKIQRVENKFSNPLEDGATVASFNPRLTMAASF